MKVVQKNKDPIVKESFMLLGQASRGRYGPGWCKREGFEGEKRGGVIYRYPETQNLAQ